MPNDISGINSGRPQQSGDRTVTSLRRDSSDTGQSRTSTGTGDTVSITDMASRLKSLETKLESQPAVDQSRVDKVRDAISRGEYRINPERVADKMMDFEADFDR
jgi:negative regulator of flagellin synthesis FlgM